MTIYLVRHAQALGRHDWGQPDDLRPLSPKGQRQARALVDLLGRAQIDRVVSSPAVRCTLTVAPLADKLGLDVELANALLEGMPAGGALQLMTRAAAASGDSVLCSHGDLIPDVLRRLTAHGMLLHDPLKWAKGSVWAIDTDAGEPTSARYLTPPE